MDKMSFLFAKCNCIDYDNIGKHVSYKFLEQNDTLYIYFECSYQPIDWIRNFLFGKKPYKDMKIPYRVHRGFLAAWREVEDLVIAKIIARNTIGSTDNYKYKQIIVVGYSHGAALAQLCHECVWFYRPDLRQKNLYTYAFEAPRVYAGFKVKKALKERWNNCFIIRNNNDIVTHLPPRLFGFANLGIMIHIHGDTSIVENKLPKCFKSHYPQSVYQGLVDYEKIIKKGE